MRFLELKTAVIHVRARFDLDLERDLRLDLERDLRFCRGFGFARSGPPGYFKDASLRREMPPSSAAGLTTWCVDRPAAAETATGTGIPSPLTKTSPDSSLMTCDHGAGLRKFFAMTSSGEVPGLARTFFS